LKVNKLICGGIEFALALRVSKKPTVYEKREHLTQLYLQSSSSLLPLNQGEKRNAARDVVYGTENAVSLSQKPIVNHAVFNLFNL